MTEVATIYVFENENGSKYYQLEELKNMFYNKNIKYDIRFPIKYVLEDINIIKKLGNRNEGIQGPGPIVCKNCFIYGSRDGIFMGYCPNCVMYDNRPGCHCLTIEDTYVCNSHLCVFKTYLKDIDIHDIDVKNIKLDMRSIKIKEEEETSWKVTQQEINERFINGESDYYIKVEELKENDDASSLCAVYNYYSDEETLFLEKEQDLEFDLDLDLDLNLNLNFGVKLKEEKEIPMLIVYALNKYEMVDISVIRERYKEVESQPTHEMMKQKIEEYDELDAKAKEQYDQAYDPLNLHISLKHLYLYDVGNYQ